MGLKAGKQEQRGFFQQLALGIFKISFGLYIKLKFNVKMEDNKAYKLSGSYILLANHTHNMDPIFIQYFWPRIISYVVNDTVWKMKWLGRILDAVGFIPIRKMTTDSQSVRGILNNIKKNRIIGIFPEGRRSWDGRTLEIIPSTANLIKKLKLPVVTVAIRGAMMSLPRWAYKARRGEVRLFPKIALTPEQIADMSVEDIQKVLERELRHNEAEYLKAHPDITFKSKAPAECLELFAYVCPDCKAVAKMRSEGDRLFCTVCGATYTFQRDATLFKASENKRYTLPEYGDLQDTHIRSVIEKAVARQDLEQMLFSDNNVKLLEYIRLRPLVPITEGTLTMNPDRMVFHGRDGVKREYPAAELFGINIQSNNQLEFSIGKQTFRFLFKEGVSPYKWQRSLMCTQTQ